METANEKERLVRVDIPVTGMTCASCVRRVERALEKKQGVAEAGVNFAAEKASVAYDPSNHEPGRADRDYKGRGLRRRRARDDLRCDGHDVRELRGEGRAGPREGAGRRWRRT